MTELVEPSERAVTRTVKTQRLKCSDRATHVAKELIVSGEVVAVPTETVYGLAADATNEAAVAKIYAAKGRPSFNPLIVHVGRHSNSCAKLLSQRLLDARTLSDAATCVSDRLMKAFWPGPLTLVLPRGEALPAVVAGGLATIGFRMPRHAAFLDLIEASQKPLAAPSANRSNRISPTTADHVIEELGGLIPLVLDGGSAPVGVESTIVAVNHDGTLTLLRPGGLPVEQITTVARAHFTELQIPLTDKPAAPGMLKLHYAPSKPLILAGAGLTSELAYKIGRLSGISRIGIMSFGALPITLDGLGLDKDLFSAGKIIQFPADDQLVASGLFNALRELDHSDVHVIVAELPSQRAGGLWPAICDRLSRGGSAHTGEF